MDNIKKELADNGYDFAVAVATEAEINAGAACGQLSIIIEKDRDNA
jgi:adenine C2-methylase RlmN of 23S rRNA A2503 and tRNA A37